MNQSRPTPPFCRFGTALLLCSLFLLGGCSQEKQASKHLKKAESFLAAGQYSSARISFLQVLEDDPTNASALTQLGTLWMDRGAPMQALPYLLEAREHAPMERDSRVQLTVALSSIGQHAEARTELERILQEDPTNEKGLLFLAQIASTPEEHEAAIGSLEALRETLPASYHLGLATVALRAGNLERGETELESALAIDGNNHLALLGMAQVKASQGKHDEAADLFQSARAVTPTYSAARTAYPKYLLATGKVDQAKDLLEEITAEAPDLIPAQRILARVYTEEESYQKALAAAGSILTLDPTRLEALVLKGRVLRLKGSLEEARDHLVAATSIPLYHENRLLHEELARTFIALKSVPEAVTALETVVQSPQASPETRLQLASLKLQTGEVSAAQEDLERYTRDYPEDLRALPLLGQAYQSTGNLDRALKVFEDFSARDPENVIAVLGLATVADAQRNFTLARTHYSRALELAPEKQGIFTKLVELDLKEGKHDDAGRKIAEMLETNPNDPTAYYLRARLGYQQERWVDTIAALQKCRSLGMSSGQVTNLLISCHLKNEDPASAREELGAMVAALPEKSPAWLSAAVLYEGLEDWEPARKAHEHVLTFAPDAVASLNNLAVIYAERLPDLDRALELATRAKSLKPDDANISDTLGWVHYKRGDHDSALPLLREAAAKLAGNANIQRHLGLTAYMMARPEIAIPALSAANKAAPAPDLSQRLALLQDFQSPEPDHTLDELETRLSDSPDDLIALLLLARRQEEAGQIDAALASLNRAHALNPGLPQTTLPLARLLFDEQGDLEKAKELASAAMQTDVTNPEAAVLMGRLTLAGGDIPGAYSLLQEHQGYARSQVRTLHDFAWATYLMGKVPESQSLMRELVALSPPAELKEKMEWFLTLTKIPDNPELSRAQEEELQATLADNPDDLPALMAQSAVLKKRGDLPGAEKGWRRILKVTPSFLPASRELAAHLANDPAQLEEAHRLAAQAYDADPKDPLLARTLAGINVKRGLYPQAVQLYELSDKGLTLDASSLFALGIAYQETGATEKAAQSFQTALAQGLAAPQAEEARSRLEDLK